MDVKTLRLASIQLTEPLLLQFLAYEQALVAELDRSEGHTDWSGRFAFAHQHALHESKLDVHTYAKVRALVGDWCSRRGTLEVVRRRLGTAKASATETLATPKEQRLIERAERELPALEQLTDLEERYGREAVALLERHGEAVLASHRTVAHREGCHQL
jgi:hypothetical protein